MSDVAQIEELAKNLPKWIDAPDSDLAVVARDLIRQSAVGLRALLDEVTRLREERDDSEDRCGKFADENQRLYDKFRAAEEKLEAISSTYEAAEAELANKRKTISQLQAEAINETNRANRAEAELSRLRTLIDGHDPDNPDDGPRCRDCADNFGICENTGLPCDPQKAAEEKVKRLRVQRDDANDAFRRQVENLRTIAARAEAAEAELARLRKPAGDELPDDLRAPLHSLQADREYLVARIRKADDEEAGLLSESIRDRLSQIEEAAYRLNGRLRAPAGDVGEVVRDLEAASEDLTQRMYSDRCGSPSCAIASNIATRAADLLTRQAAEIEEWKQAADVEARQRRHETDRATSAEARLREAGEIVAMFDTRIKARGEWDDGCFYHNGISASELQEPLTRARAFLSTLEPTNE